MAPVERRLAEGLPRPVASTGLFVPSDGTDRPADAEDSGAAAGAGGAVSVSALNRAVAGALARGFPLVRVRGEIANLARAASGHWYFTLKDAAAQVRCAMFRGRNALVDFAPRDGDAVLVTARVGLYEPRGEYQLTVEALQRDGQGRLYEEFLRRKARFEAEGLFDPAKRRPLPLLPRAVGVVTSLQAAALRDVVSTLRRRAPHVAIVVYPVPVQGVDAAPRIADMLARANARAEVDVLLLVRGGGSIEDLWAFNEEAVVRAVRGSRLPVVVGVGHESDVTLADLAGDLRAPTPTAAAELVSSDVASLRAEVAQRLNRIRRCAVMHAQHAAQRLDYAVRALSGPRAALQGPRERVRHLAGRAEQALIGVRHRATLHLAGAQRMLPRLRPSVAPGRVALQRALAALSAGWRGHRLQREARVTLASRALAQLDPLAVLARGYSLVTDAQGRVVSRAGQAPVGSRLDIRFGQGSATAEVVASREAPSMPAPSASPG